MHGYIASPFKRTEKISAHSEGVVNHYAYSLSAGHLYDRFIVRDIECRVADVFKIYGFGAAVDKGFKIGDMVALCEAYFYAHISEGDCKHRECASIEERLGDDIVSRTADICDREEYCRLS